MTGGVDRIVTDVGVYVTAKGAVEELTDPDNPDVTEAMVRRWAERHHITPTRLGGRAYFPLDNLRAAEKSADEDRDTKGGRPRPGGLTSP